jgi:hypothetical protein
LHSFKVMVCLLAKEREAVKILVFVYEVCQ